MANNYQKIIIIIKFNFYIAKNSFHWITA